MRPRNLEARQVTQWVHACRAILRTEFRSPAPRWKPDDTHTYNLALVRSGGLLASQSSCKSKLQFKWATLSQENEVESNRKRHQMPTSGHAQKEVSTHRFTYKYTTCAHTQRVGGGRRTRKIMYNKLSRPRLKILSEIYATSDKPSVISFIGQY